MDLEIIILSEVRERKTNIWYHLYVGMKKKKIQIHLFIKQNQTHKKKNKLVTKEEGVEVLDE